MRVGTCRERENGEEERITVGDLSRHPADFVQRDNIRKEAHFVFIHSVMLLCVPLTE